MIINNLKQTFPEKGDQEIMAICKESYRNLSDVLLEAIKGFTLSADEIRKRYGFDDDPKLQEYFEKGQNLLATAAHLTNWEWGAYSTGICLKHKIIGVYKKVSHPYINQHMIDSRSKFDVQLAEMKETSELMEVYQSDRPYMLVLIADQRPSDPRKGFWTNFLGRETAFFYGAEKFAIQYKLPVLNFDIHRVKRGYYHVHIEWLCEDPENIKTGDVIKAYRDSLEREIRVRPAEWLWSHSRWKHARPADVPMH